MGAGASKAAMMCGTPGHLVVSRRLTGLDAHGMALARQLRARTPPVSWQHIARQCGVSEDAVRRAVDDGYVSPFPSAAPREAAARTPLSADQVGAARGAAPVRADSQEHRTLWAVSEGVCGAQAVADRFGWSRTNASTRLDRLCAKGLITNPAWGSWVLTGEGAVLVRSLGEPKEASHG